MKLKGHIVENTRLPPLHSKCSLSIYHHLLTGVSLQILVLSELQPLELGLTTPLAPSHHFQNIQGYFHMVFSKETSPEPLFHEHDPFGPVCVEMEIGRDGQK